MKDTDKTLEAVERERERGSFREEKPFICCAQKYVELEQIYALDKV